MLTHELLTELQKFNFKQNFQGIFSADNVPSKIDNLKFVIVNTDVSSGPGKHWYALVRLNNLIECFDSLGVTEDRKQFICSHIKGIRFVSINLTPLQPFSSQLCGQFVLYYLFERYQNLDLKFSVLLNQCFDDNVVTNEQFVKNFMTEWM